MGISLDSDCMILPIGGPRVQLPYLERIGTHPLPVSYSAYIGIGCEYSAIPVFA